MFAVEIELCEGKLEKRAEGVEKNNLMVTRPASNRTFNCRPAHIMLVLDPDLPDIARTKLSLRIAFARCLRYSFECQSYCKFVVICWSRTGTTYRVTAYERGLELQFSLKPHLLAMIPR